jgi:hypothetical protein
MHRCYGRIASGAHDPQQTKAELKTRSAAVLCAILCRSNGLKVLEAANRSVGLELQPLDLQNPPYDFENAFRAAMRSRVEAIFVLESAPIFRGAHANRTARHEKPTTDELRIPRVCGGWRPRLLRRELRGHVPARGGVRKQNSTRHKETSIPAPTLLKAVTTVRPPCLLQPAICQKQEAPRISDQVSLEVCQGSTPWPVACIARPLKSALHGSLVIGSVHCVSRRGSLIGRLTQ